jgi:hypothetical protein
MNYRLQTLSSLVYDDVVDVVEPVVVVEEEMFVADDRCKRGSATRRDAH